MKIRDHQIIFKAIVGSHSYGTNVEGSDIDFKGVYIQTPKSVLYDGYVPQIEVGKDETYYEVRRFLELCETANPTVLELLYSPEDCIIYEHPVFKLIK
jgi:predicted nucleotidyltransferase